MLTLTFDQIMTCFECVRLSPELFEICVAVRNTALTEINSITIPPQQLLEIRNKWLAICRLMYMYVIDCNFFKDDIIALHTQGYIVRVYSPAGSVSYICEYGDQWNASLIKHRNGLGLQILM